jgi:predicted regulator of Ras-like GTPase activity (Roadblock/LC7/MglB family)
MSSVQTTPEYASRAARLDRILAELLRQTPGVEAAAVVSFDGLPMASALPADMDEDRVAAMSAALLSLAERASQDLGRGDLSQVYIEGEHGSVFLVSAKDEAVLIAVTAAGAKVGMMLYEVKLAANKVGEALQGPVPLPTPLPSNLTRGYPDAEANHHVIAADSVHEPDAEEPADAGPVIEPVNHGVSVPLNESVSESSEPAEEAVNSAALPFEAPAFPEPLEPAAQDQAASDADAPTYDEPANDEPADDESAAEPAYAEPAYAEASYHQPGYREADYAQSLYSEPAHAEPAYQEPVSADAEHHEQGFGSPLYDQVAHAQTVRPDYFASINYAGAADSHATFDEPQAPAVEHVDPTPWYAQHAPEPHEQPDAEAAEPAAVATDNGWSSYAPSATVLPGEPTTWS